MEARAIKARHAGTQGLLYDQGNDRDTIRLHGGKLKNHASENVRKMRQQAKERKAHEEERIAVLNEKKSFKLSQFKDVQGRAQEEAELKAQIAEKYEYTKAGSGRTCAGAHMPSEEASQYVPRSKEKPRVPRKEELPNSPQPKPQTNFLHKNFTKAVKNDTPNRQHMSPNKSTLPTRTSARGVVPKYITNRKEMLAYQAQMERDNYDPNCPQGMMAMPEEERLSALELLNRNKIDLTTQLSKISFCRSHATDKKQNEIYGKLNEIDAAIDVFSKPKVYVTA